MRLIGVMFALIGALAGCSVMGYGSSDFSCDRRQVGVGCASVEEIYKASNGADYKARLQDQAEQKKDVPDTLRPRPEAIAAVTPLQPPNYPAPVLEPASVLRIWLAPWVDDRKALHWPSYLFAEVTPRKWSFGNVDFREVRQLSPLQVDRRKLPEESDEASPSSNPLSVTPRFTK